MTRYQYHLNLRASAACLAFLIVGCGSDTGPVPLSNIISGHGGSGICLFDEQSFDCAVKDVTDGSGYSRIWEISGDSIGGSVSGFLFANPDNESWQIDLTRDGDNLVSGVDVRAFQSGEMGCLRADFGGDILCLQIQQPPFSDVQCRNDGPPLPKSGLCMDSATKWLDFPDGQVGAVTEPYPGCDWRIQETMTGDDAMMIYLASHCDGKSVRLGFNGGAATGTFTIIPEVTDLENPPFGFVTLIHADPIQQLDNLEAFSQPETPSDYRCEASFANLEGWPNDAIIVDRFGAEDDDAFRMDCGRFGFMADATSYWRLVGPFALHFDLGQDAYHPAAPSSFTYMVKDDVGNWTRWVPEALTATDQVYPLASEENRPRTQTGCERLGGNWHRAGLLGAFRCTFAYSDAGQPCSDSQDCDGSCYATAAKVEENPDMPGVCEATDSPFGCNAPVVDGIVMPPICVD